MLNEIKCELVPLCEDLYEGKKRKSIDQLEPEYHAAAKLVNGIDEAGTLYGTIAWESVEELRVRALGAKAPQGA